MNPRKIVIVSALQIIDTPRVVKEADALAEAGFDVEVMAAIHNPSSIERIGAMLQGRRWRHTPVVDLTDRRPVSVARHALMRAKTNLMRTARWHLQWDNSAQLGFATGALCKAALASRADLYSVHIEQALWTGKVLVERNLPVRIDVEDWYSEDGLPADRALRPIKLIKTCERLLLNRAVHSTTTSLAMSRALGEAYGCRPPEVVYNSFPITERGGVDGRRIDRLSVDSPSIIWFSQTIGPGRGLEALIDALRLLEVPVEVHLRGKARPGYLEGLLAPLPEHIRRRVRVHEQVPQAELLSRLMEHDIGYCGELNTCLNSDLTISNKCLEYLRAGLALVASDTTGQLEVASGVPEAVSVFRQADRRALAEALRPLLTDGSRLARAKRASWTGFEEAFGWEASKRRIQTQVEAFFSKKTVV
jgi:glycosyltransferase involved in cell wall biosynthesis